MKIANFIDGGYLSAVLKKVFGETRIDFAKLSNKLAGEDYHLRTYYYYCMPYQSNSPSMEEKKRYADARKFISALEKIPRFEVRLGRLVMRTGDRGPKFEQKGVDVLLSVDLVRMSWDHQMDVASILTGDSDFVPAIKSAKEAGIVIKLFYVPGNCGNELLTVCDERIEIDQEFVNEITL